MMMLDTRGLRTMQCSLPTGHALLFWPASCSVQDIDELSEVIALQLRGVRRDVLRREAEAPGQLEYASWFPIPAGGGS